MTLHLCVLIDVKDEFVLMERDDHLRQVLLFGVKFGQIKLHFVSSHLKPGEHIEEHVGDWWLDKQGDKGEVLTSAPLNFGLVVGQEFRFESLHVELLLIYKSNSDGGLDDVAHLHVQHIQPKPPFSWHFSKADLSDVQHGLNMFLVSISKNDAFEKEWEIAVL